MLYILLGQDDFSLHQSLEGIKRSLGAPAILAANTTTLDGQQLTLDQLRAVCETVPFLAERRLVIVKGLLERFEPKGSSSRREKMSQAPNRQNECKSFAAYLGNMPDSTVLVLMGGRVGRNNPLLKELSAKAEVRSFSLLPLCRRFLNSASSSCSLAESRRMIWVISAVA